MKLHARRKSSGGLTRLEVFCCLAAVSVLVFFFVMIPCGLSNSMRRATRIFSCASNLKQAGLSMRLFANDHDGNFPWMISTNLGGSQEFTNSSEVFRHFLAASNELVTPRVLQCAVDSARLRVGDFAQFSNSNLSYFVSLDAAPSASGSDPSILSGDRNIVGGTASGSALRVVRKSDRLAWSKEIHGRAGNLGRADGSVLQADDSGLNRAVAAMTNTTIRLAIP